MGGELFGRDKDPPPSWTLDLLTTEYVVSGRVEPDNQSLADIYLQYQGTGKPAGHLILESPTLTSVHGLDAPAAPGGTWIANLETALVAVIPRDDASLAVAQRHLPTKRATPAAALAGPFHIAGTLHHTYDLGLSTVELAFALTDVTVSVLVPGWAGGRISAPLAIVSTANLHGLVTA